MEIVVAQVVAVLGKFVLDQGDGLLEKAGKAAADAWHELYDTVIGRLKDDPTTTVIAEGFENKPEDYTKPLENELKKQLEVDPELEAKLTALVARWEAAAPTKYSVKVGDHSVVAVGEGNIAAGAGAAVATGGSTIIKDSTQSGNVGQTSDDEPP